MSNISTFYIKNREDLICRRQIMLIGEKYRFSMLTDRLIRLEYSPNGVFENRATGLVSFRNFEPSLFYVTESETLLQIKTSYYTLTYVKNMPFKGGKIAVGNTLKVVLNDTDKEWYYGHPEARNYGGGSYSLEDITNGLKQEKGLYSTDGFVAIDDSNSYVLADNDEFIKRENPETDVYLFMYRRDLGLCFKDYFTLTGYPTLIPRYALGNWWYKNDRYDLKTSTEVINKFHDFNIPISIFLLGDKWHDNKSNFDFDESLFPGSEFSKYCLSKNIRLGTTIDPSLGISNQDKCYAEYSKYINKDGKDINLLPMDNIRLSIYINIIVRLLESKGVTLFNIDYNNKNDRNTLWLLDHYHLGESSVRERGLILTRNPGIAPHRYPVLYSGKTIVSWQTLNFLPYYNATASNMGVSWWAHAIGGYYGGIEDDELYLRYIQLGTFSPIFILASDAGKYYKREPWKWNALMLNVIKEYMQLRHRLIPYIYSEGYIYHKTGSPLIQPMYYKYPKIIDEPLYKNQYYFGTQLLVAPITKEKNSTMNRVVQRLFIPEGTWYDLKSGMKFPGNKYYVSFYKDEDYPVFCKAGCIIPMSNDLNTTSIPINMELQVFPGENNMYKLYEDDGISNNYKTGDYAVTGIEFTYANDNYRLTIKPLEGRIGILPSTRNYKIRFRNTSFSAEVSAIMGNAPFQINKYQERNDLVVELTNVSTRSELLVGVTGTNIEIHASRLINDDIKGILDDLEIETETKEKIDAILFSDMSIKKKRIEIKKVRKLELRFEKMFINLLEYIEQV